MRVGRARVRSLHPVTLALGMLASVVLTVGTPARAATITPVGGDAAGAGSLASAMVADPATLVSASFVATTGGGPNAVADGLSFFPTFGSSFGILTSGSAALADDPNVSGSSGANNGGGNVRGNTDYDVTILKLRLNTPTGRNCLTFDLAFYSEEFPEYVGSAYNDAFIAELDTTTWTTSGSSISAPNNFAHDASGDPITVNSTGAGDMEEINAAGTTYDGATVLLQASTPITGGAHDLYLSIFDQGDQIYDSAAFVDNIRFRTVSSPAQCRSGVKTSRTPTIVVHGIMGAFLRNPGGEVWPNEGATARSIPDNHFNVLKLAANGVDPAEPGNSDYNISVMTEQGIEGIIDVAELCLFGRCKELGDAYKTTFRMFEAAGYRRGVTLFPFAFDFRKSVASNGTKLLAKIDAVLDLTGHEKVNIVAHSQGGLVTRAALSLAGSFGKVDRVVTLGTPMLGATESIGVLDYKEPCKAAEVAGKCFLNRGKAQELVTNWPGFLDLLPSRNFYKPYISPIFAMTDLNGDGRDDGFLSFDQVRATLADRNLPLIDQSAAWHAAHDLWAPFDSSVRMMRVVGSGGSTVTRIILFDEEVCSGILWWHDCKMEVKSQFGYASGDETVPLHSADLYDPAHGLDLRGTGTNAYAPGIAHGDLVKTQHVIDFVVSFLAGSGGSSASTVPGAPAAAGQIAEGITDTPTFLNGLEVTVRGDIAGSVADPAGRIVGIEDEWENETSDVPGAVYFSGDRFGSFFFTQSDAYAGRWVAAGSGEATIVFRTYVEDEVAALVTSPRVMLTEGAVVTMSFTGDPNLASLSMAIDDDGDGDVDRSVPFEPPLAGPDARDVIQPKTLVTVERFTSPEGQKMARVVAAATDEGSGVARVEYAIDATGQTGVYTGALVLPARGDVYVRAIDRAGNVEAPYAVATLDDFPGRMTAVRSFVKPEPLATVEGFVEYGGDTDWIGFEAAAGYSAFTLVPPGKDYDAALFDAAGNEIWVGNGRGAAPEALTLQLDAGRYFLRVTSHAGAFDESLPYRVTVGRAGP